MVEQRRDKRFRVSGEDEAGDIHAFETDDRGRAELMKDRFEETYRGVTLDRLRVRP